MLIFEGQFTFKEHLNFKSISAAMHAGLDLNLQTESFTSPTQTDTMFPQYATYEEDPKPLQFCMPNFNLGIQGVQQFQNPTLVLNLIKPENTPTGEGLGSWENSNGIQDNGMRYSRQRGVDEAPFAIGDGSGSSQFMLNGVANVVEPMRPASFGVLNRGEAFCQQYPFQVFNGFRGGTSDELNNQTQIAENIIDNAAERRHRRMIKNRESAARSRARQQAYNVQLLIEIKKLKKENDELGRTIRNLSTVTRMKREKNRRGAQRTFSAP